MTDSDRLRREEEVVREVWDTARFETFKPADAYAKVAAIIRQERLAAMEWLLDDLWAWLARNQSAAAWEVQAYLEEMAVSLPELLRRATEAGATENTNKENE